MTLIIHYATHVIINGLTMTTPITMNITAMLVETLVEQQKKSHYVLHASQDDEDDVFIVV